MEGAVGKLLGSGLLAVRPDLTFALTPEGSALAQRRHGSLFTQVDSVLSLLAPVTARAQQFALPPRAMEHAVDAHRGQQRER